MTHSFPRLSSDHNELESHYDVIIVGSGYGASIAASRCARAGQTVCVLERGKEWLPGSFPESAEDGAKNFQINFHEGTHVGKDLLYNYSLAASKIIKVI